MKVNIPETLNDIKLSTWQKYHELVKDKDPASDFVRRKTLSIFYGINEYQLMKVKDITKLIDELNAVFNQKPELTQRFEFNGVEYGLIPNFDDITFAELTDLDLYVEEKDYHKLMSILYRPIVRTFGKTYEIKPYNGSNDKLKDMPYGIVLGVLDFFLRIGEQLTNAIQSYSLESFLVKRKLLSPRSGDGINQSIL